MTTIDQQKEVAHEPVPEERAQEHLQDGMLFSAARETLLRALHVMNKATDSQGVAPYTLVLLSARKAAGGNGPGLLEVTCTNFTAALCLQVEANVEHEGAFAVPAKALCDCVLSFPKGQAVRIERQQDSVEVRCGQRIFHLRGGMDAHTFPRVWQNVPFGPGMLLAADARQLAQAVSEVQFCAAGNLASTIFSTVSFHLLEDHLELVATDMSRLAIRTLPLPTPIEGCDETFPVLASSLRLFTEIMPAEHPVTVVWDSKKNMAVFQAGWGRLVTSLDPGTYPSYTPALPKTILTTFVLPAKGLAQILKAFRPFVRDSDNYLNLSYQTDTVRFSAASQQVGEVIEELNIPIAGPAGDVALNFQHLVEVLKSLSASEAFTFHLAGARKAVMLTPVDRQDYRYVLMPLPPR